MLGQSTTERYFEDLFYFGVSYNMLLDTPNDVKLQNLSYGIQVGLFRDIPLNKKGTHAIGLGLGYAINSYYSNLGAYKGSSLNLYELVPEDVDYSRNKFATHAVEVPIEFRWRNSTKEDYSFWRIYPGFKASYVFYGLNKLVTDSGNAVFRNNDFRSLNYGATLSVGYNTWNVNVYYGLNPMLNDSATIQGNPITMKPLRIGVIFYIL